MPIGFTQLDYLVGIAAVVAALILMVGPPHRLLMWLPLLLTIDFLLPVGSSTTPARVILLFFIPFVALILFPRNKRVYGRTAPLAVFWLVAVSAALVWALVGEALVLRSSARAAYYLGILGLFAYCAKHLREPGCTRALMAGFFIAGMVHATHGLYQLIAFQFGLPFRGIVYSDSSGGVAPTVNGILRVNGFADEPKRLGYVLFTAAIAGFGLAHLERRNLRRYLLSAGAVFCLAISVFTFSASYMLAAAVSGFLLLVFGGLLSRRALIATLAGTALTIAVVGTSPTISDALTDVVTSRSSELEQGIDGFGPVYRVELFAEEYLRRHPLTALTGVGLGTYNLKFDDEFGYGSGFDATGGIRPLNSQALEITFDLGGAVMLSLYLALAWLCIRAQRQRDAAMLGCILLFLLVQSLTLEVMPYACLAASALFSGFAAKPAPRPVAVRYPGLADASLATRR